MLVLLVVLEVTPDKRSFCPDKEVKQEAPSNITHLLALAITHPLLSLTLLPWLSLTF